jgi:hypothetical protein
MGLTERKEEEAGEISFLCETSPLFFSVTGIFLVPSCHTLLTIEGKIGCSFGFNKPLSGL